MGDPNELYDVGYSRPPRKNQFVKGRSGNPKGRPKGSRNLATILKKACRERVQVKTERGTRSITKLEAAVTQLANKAASGEPRSIRDLLYWTRLVQDAEEGNCVLPIAHERDSAVMSNILARLRQAELPAVEAKMTSPSERPAPPEE